METFHWKLLVVLSLIAGNCWAVEKKPQYLDLISQGCSGIGRGFDKSLHRELGFHWKHITVAGVKLDYDTTRRCYLVAPDQFYEGEVVEWDLIIESDYPHCQYSAKLRYPNKTDELDRRRRQELKDAMRLQ